MRDFKGMKRQRGRNRGGGQTGGKPQQHNANRAFESNGPDNVKIRGAAQHVFEKYQQLARDAHSSGDRVLAENYLQHAEHYFRVIRAVQPNRPTAEIMGRDAFASGYDIDFEDENGDEGGQESSEGNEAEANDQGNGRQEYRSDQQRSDQPRNDQSRNDQQRNDQQRNDQQQRTDGRQDYRQPRRDDRPSYNRDDRPREERVQRDERPRDDRPREERVARDERPREEQPRREYTPREDRPQRDRNYNRDDRTREPRPDPLAVVQPQATPLTEPPAEASSPMLRSQDGGVSHAPAFLQVRPEPAKAETPAAPAEAAEKPARRTRTRKPAASTTETEQA